MPDAIDQLAAHVRSQLGSRVAYARPWRVDALVRLVVRHWPAGHLRDAERDGGRCSKTVDHALLLMRSQVRERWEARHGVGPMWDLVLGGTVTATGQVLMRLWWADAGWRARLVELSRLAADDRNDGVDHVVDRTGEP